MVFPKRKNWSAFLLFKGSVSVAWCNANDRKIEYWFSSTLTKPLPLAALPVHYWTMRVSCKEWAVALDLGNPSSPSPFGLIGAFICTFEKAWHFCFKQWYTYVMSVLSSVSFLRRIHCVPYWLVIYLVPGTQEFLTTCFLSAWCRTSLCPISESPVLYYSGLVGVCGVSIWMPCENLM